MGSQLKDTFKNHLHTLVRSKLTMYGLVSYLFEGNIITHFQ